MHDSLKASGKNKKPGRDFVVECEQSKTLKNRDVHYFYRDSQHNSTKASTVNFLPAKSEIPVQIIKPNPTQYEIVVKP